MARSCTTQIDHLMTNNLFTESEHGFISGRYCIHCIHCIHLDFGKDSVPSRIKKKIHKLPAYSMKGYVVHWLESFTKAAAQRVSINGSLSKLAAVFSGILQGSILGPMLFNIFVNDIPEIIHSMIQMFVQRHETFSLD